MNPRGALAAHRTGQVRRLVLAYFERLGARIEDLENDLFRVEMSPAQAAELEGGWTPVPGPWTPGAPAQATYYFTFSPGTAEAHAEAELLAPGSRRLDQVIASIRRIGGATRVWLPAPAGSRGASPFARLYYRPFYLFTLGIEFTNVPKAAEVARAAVDAVDQIALAHGAELIAGLPLESGYPDGRDGIPVEAAGIDAASAFPLAYESVLQRLEAQDSSWALSAGAAIDRERDRLLAFLAAREKAGDDVAAERERRLAELEKSRPGAIVRVRGVAEVFLPVLREGESVHHLAFEAPRP